MEGDIELEINPGTGRGNYTVRVIRAPAGGAPQGSLQLDVDAVLNRLAELEKTVLLSAVSARRSLPFTEKPLREVGQQLFDALFTREIYGAYRASLGAAQHNEQQLRLVLRFGAPELAALPWETLFDAETDSYLCRTEPLLRQIPAPDYHPKPLEVEPPLRVLGVIASPRDLPGLNVEAEKQRLVQALAEPIADGLVELVWVAHASWEGIHAKLLAGPWHVVHFVGHGDYDSYTDEGRIALAGPDGRAAMVEATRLVDLLSIARPTPRLVVLNSCASGQAGEQDLFSGTAAALVRSGINAVAAMQFTVSDNAAIAFAHGFYTAIAYGRGIDEALRSGRISILGEVKGTLEWVTPVLYVRGGSTQLFNLRRSRSVPAGGTESREAAQPLRADTRQAGLRALYVQASADLRMKRYEAAVDLFDDLLSLDPEYRDAAALRESARLRGEIMAAYRTALDAEDAGDWVAAARGYARVQAHPAFAEVSLGDAARRQEICEARQRISDLRDELTYHAGAEEWQAVLEIDAELAVLDPAAANPDGLADRARAGLRSEQERRDEASRDAQASRDAEAPREPKAPREPDAPRQRPDAAVHTPARAAAQPVAVQPAASPSPAPSAAAPSAPGAGGASHAASGAATRPVPAGAPQTVPGSRVNPAYLSVGGGALILTGLVLLPVLNQELEYGAFQAFWRFRAFLWLAGLGLLILAGLPDRSLIGRILLGAAAVCGGSWAVAVAEDAPDDVLYPLVALELLCGLAAALWMVRAGTLGRWIRWLLLALFALQAPSWLLDPPWNAPWNDGVWVIFNGILLSVVGALLLLAAFKLTGKRPTAPDHGV